ncbi:ABC transporter permease [Parapedobacter deserti]|uniref:ABC transporter permease n=1 Tax=Parapedobacter deserti TaxID=1912957 RepID=A0ABV7JJF9_9SPHI
MLSLSIGICATLVIFLMIQFDYSFDKHLPHGDRVYRIVSNGDFENAGVLVPLIRSITIASLGLFGLAIFTANQRTKEIGIRKVLGASVGQLTVLLAKNLVSLVLVACLIAVPIAWYFMHKWLDDFAYKTPLHWWVFGIAALGLLIVATAVLAAKTYYAARANPVDSLRNE